MSKKRDCSGDLARRSRKTVRLDIDDPEYQRALFGPDEIPEGGLLPQQVIARGCRRSADKYGQMPRVKGPTTVRKMTPEEIATHFG